MIKFADKIIEEIKAREKITDKDKVKDFVTGEDFEKWLRQKRTVNQKSNKNLDKEE